MATPIPATPAPHSGPSLVPPSPTDRSEFVLKHLLKTVLGFRDGSPPTLALAFDGIETVHDLLSLTEARIDTLCYIPPDETRLPKSLPLGHRNKLQLFLRWRHHLETLQGGRMMSLDDWMKVEQADFDDFRISSPSEIPTSTATGFPGTSTPVAAKPSNLIADFK